MKKIEFSFNDDNDYNSFLTALNHAFIGYQETIWKSMLYGLSDNLPKIFWDKWKEEAKLNNEEIIEIIEKDLKILINFYNKVKEMEE